MSYLGLWGGIWEGRGLTYIFALAVVLDVEVIVLFVLAADVAGRRRINRREKMRPRIGDDILRAALVAWGCERDGESFW